MTWTLASLVSIVSNGFLILVMNIGSQCVRKGQQVICIVTFAKITDPKLIMLFTLIPMMMFINKTPYKYTNVCETRMHSSRMRTAAHWPYLVVSARGGMNGTHAPLPCKPPYHTRPRHTCPLWTEWQTGVKILPCPNFVAGGNKPPTSHVIYLFQVTTPFSCKTGVFSVNLWWITCPTLSLLSVNNIFTENFWPGFYSFSFKHYSIWIKIIYPSRSWSSTGTHPLHVNKPKRKQTCSENCTCRPENQTAQ